MWNKLPRASLLLFLFLNFYAAYSVQIIFNNHSHEAYHAQISSIDKSSSYFSTTIDKNSQKGYELKTKSSNKGTLEVSRGGQVLVKDEISFKDGATYVVTDSYCTQMTSSTKKRNQSLVDRLRKYATSDGPTFKIVATVGSAIIKEIVSTSFGI